MIVSANLKCDFSNLKYEQLLAEKYFVESCFSKVYESYKSKQRLIDLAFKVNSECVVTFPRTTEVEEIECTTTTTTTTSTTTTSTTTTTTLPA